jgi:hypothetical protein
MTQSVLEQLGQQQVPPGPAGFRRRLHDRINARLVAVHLVEVAVRVLPYACFHFLLTLFGALRYSLTSRYAKGEDDAERHDHNR